MMDLSKERDICLSLLKQIEKTKNKDLATIIKKHIFPLVETDCYIKRHIPRIKKEKKAKCLIGLSGGADSIGALYLAERLGFDIDCIHIGYNIFPKQKDKVIQSIQKKFRVNFVNINEGSYYNRINALLEKNKKPCSFCFKSKLATLKSFAKKQGIKLIITGDIVSKRGKSLKIEDGILFFALPAFLNLTEQELIKFSEKLYKGKAIYSCPVPYLLINNKIRLNIKWKKFWLDKIENWGSSFDSRLKERFKVALI